MRAKHTRLGAGAKRFSLVELLVAIAIIAILSALLFPALGKARDMAKSVDCQGRLKQMLVGMAGYTSDNNDWYPYLNVGSAGDVQYMISGTNLFEAMDSYVFGKDTPGLVSINFYSCSADVPAGKVNRRMCYGVNRHYDSRTGARDGILKGDTATVNGAIFVGSACRTSRVKDFSGTFLFACYANTIRYCYTYHECFVQNMDGPYNVSIGWMMGLLHNKGTNWGFCDGHVAWARWQDAVGTGDYLSPKGVWTQTPGD